MRHTQSNTSVTTSDALSESNTDSHLTRDPSFVEALLPEFLYSEPTFDETLEKYITNDIYVTSDKINENKTNDSEINFDFKEKKADKQLNANKMEDYSLDDVEKTISSLLSLAEDVGRKRSLICKISHASAPHSDSDTYKRRQFHYETQNLNKKEKEDKFDFLLDREKHTKHRTIDSSKIAPFDSVFSKWEQVGTSYRVNPNPPKLRHPPTVIDFITNSHYRAFMLGQCAADIETEMTFFDAQLVQSRALDEITIPYLKYNILLDKAAAKIVEGLMPTTKVESLMKKKMKCDKSTRYFSGYDLSYRPITLLRPNDLPNAEFQFVDWENIPRFSFLLLMTESNIPSCQKNALGECIGTTIRLLKKAKDKQEMDFHLIVPANGVIFLFFLFSMYSRMEDYCMDGSFLTLFAEFEVLGISFHAPLLEKETKKLVSNVNEGCCLSRLFFELKNSAVSVIGTNVLREMENAFDFMLGLKSAVKYYGYERTVFQERKLYTVKVIVSEDGKKLSLDVKEPTKLINRFRSIPITPPMNNSLLFTGFGNVDINCSLKDEPDPVSNCYEKRGLLFKPSSTKDDHDEAAYPSISFVPGTSDFFFAL